MSSTTRTQIVRSAQDLFFTQGFHATSLAAVRDHAQVNGGSVYYFFKTKNELLVAVLESYLERLQTEIMEPAFAATSHPLERVFAVLAGYRQRLVDSDFATGCPIGNLALELPDAEPEVRQRIEANFDAWCQGIAECLERVPGLETHDPPRLARLVLTFMEGAIVQARGRRDIEPFDEAVASLRSHFDGLGAAAAV